MLRKLLVATHNRGKMREFAEMLAGMEIEWLDLDDVQVTTDVPETGSTFAENARLKARAYATMTGLLTLADDSGLEVDALQGAPGVLTARYGGAGLSHADRYQLLLQNLANVAWEERTARFRCAIALSAPDGQILAESEGVCEGVIALEPSGSGGFGYDPVFFLPQYGQTMAEVGSAIKHQISHRGRALGAIADLLRELVISTDKRSDFGSAEP